MAYTESNICVTLTAAADYRLHQYKFVSVNSSGAAELTDDDGHAVGVLMNAPNIGEAAEVATVGIVKVVCAGVVTCGADVAAATDGEAKNVDTGSAVNGTALETGADGKVISILFHPRG